MAITKVVNDNKGTGVESVGGLNLATENTFW